MRGENHLYHQKVKWGPAPGTTHFNLKHFDQLLKSKLRQPILSPCGTIVLGFTPSCYGGWTTLCHTKIDIRLFYFFIMYPYMYLWGKFQSLNVIISIKQRLDSYFIIRIRLLSGVNSIVWISRTEFFWVLIGKNVTVFWWWVSCKN